MELIQRQFSEDVTSLRRDMDRLFEDFLEQRPWWRGEQGKPEPPIEVFDTKDTVIVKAAVPGVRPEDVKVTITQERLTLEGEVKRELGAEALAFAKDIARELEAFNAEYPEPEMSDKDRLYLVERYGEAVPGPTPRELIPTFGDFFYDYVTSQRFYQQEFRYGAFSRTIPLPVAVQEDKATAQLKDGVLTITVPKSEQARGKEIRLSHT